MFLYISPNVLLIVLLCSLLFVLLASRRFYCEPETDWAEAGAADGQEASEASDATAEERGDAAGSASQPQRSVLWTVRVQGKRKVEILLLSYHNI